MAHPGMHDSVLCQAKLTHADAKAVLNILKFQAHLKLKSTQVDNRPTEANEHRPMYMYKGEIVLTQT